MNIDKTPSLPLAGDVDGLCTRPEDTAEQFIQAAVDSAPEPLRRLGEWLANKLDDDDWKTAERLLNGAASECRSLAGRVEGLQTNLDHAVESRRIQEAHREAAETALAAEKRAREEAEREDETRTTESIAVRDKFIIERDLWLEFVNQLPDKRPTLDSTVAAALEAAETHSAALARALEEAKEITAEYRDAVRVDVLMEGPKFAGCNLSQLKRAWDADRARFVTQLESGRR